MSELVWDAAGEKRYETGLSKGVLYVMGDSSYNEGVPWNGLISVSENPEGAEPNDLYADDIKYATLRSAETFGATVEAYTYPDEFAECDGSAELKPGITIGQQSRKTFAFSYVTQVGSDAGETDNYNLHIVYGCTASPSQKQYQTINDSPEAITFSWEIDSIPVNVTGHKPTATVVINSKKVGSANMKKITDKLYGTASGKAEVLLPDAIAALIAD